MPTGISFTSSSVIGTHTATAKTFEVPRLSMTGRPRNRASPVIPRNPVSAVPVNTRQPSVHTGSAIAVSNAIVHSCAAASATNAPMPAVWVMRGRETTSATPEIASPTFDTIRIVLARPDDEADLAAYAQATRKPTDTAIITMIVLTPEGIAPINPPTHPATETNTLAPAISFSRRSPLGEGAAGDAADQVAGAVVATEANTAEAATGDPAAGRAVPGAIGDATVNPMRAPHAVQNSEPTSIRFPQLVQ
jgi:hypothetical protein